MADHRRTGKVRAAISRHLSQNPGATTTSLVDYLREKRVADYSFWTTHEVWNTLNAMVKCGMIFKEITHCGRARFYKEVPESCSFS